MIGRMAELTALKSAFCTSAEKHQLSVVTVVGEAGLGKSRLLREFQVWLKALPNCRASLFCGRGKPETTSQPFSLIRDVLRSRFEIQDSDAANIARAKFEQGYASLLGDSEQGLREQSHKIGRALGFDFLVPGNIPDPLQDGLQTRHEIFQGLGILFTGHGSVNGREPGAAETSGRSLVLLLDDLQWADDDSLDLVTYLADNCQSARIMILALARPSLVERRPAWGEGIKNHARLELEPLSLRESEMLVETLMNPAQEVPDAIRETILADAGGHPFYIEEIIKVLIEKSVILPRPGGWEFDANRLAVMPVSATLRGVLRARLDGLPTPERQVIQCASVVGSVFWDNTVESLCKDLHWPEVPQETSKRGVSEILADLCRKDFINRRESSGFSGTVEYAFKHELLRDVIFETMPKKSRCEHHAQVAAWFLDHSGDRTREFSGLVAVHSEQAGQWATAAEWYGQAGEHAWNSFAPGAASDYFQKAVNLYLSTPENRERKAPVAWYEGLSKALTATGRFTDALASCRQVAVMAEQAGDIAGEARAWNGMAYLHERCAEYRASIEAAEKAALLAQRAGDQSGDEVVRSFYLKGWALYRMSDAPAVLALAAKILDLCERLEKRNWMANCFNLFGVANLQLGRYREAERYFNQALALCLESGERRYACRMFSNLGECARLQSDFTRAASLYQQALNLAREIGDRPGEVLYLSNLGGARLGLNQFQEAELDLRQAIAMRGLSKSVGVSETYTFLAQACLGQGKLPEALAAARQAVLIGLQMENPLEQAGSWRALGEVLAAMAQSGAVSNIVLESGAAQLNCDADYCFAESIQLFQAIGATDELARVVQLRERCRSQSTAPGNSIPRRADGMTGG
jgi:predicted ATPase